LPRVRRETPASDAPDATGIDGVSMGGALALRIGLTNPAAFGAVGSLQAAIAEEHATELTELARAARAKRPSLKLRLVTSHDDYFRGAITHLSEAWHAGGIAHDFADIPGPHDYAFNRGPGSIELLTYYDRALR
jgi:iron(III)-salmochelin esterase